MPSQQHQQRLQRSTGEDGEAQRSTAASQRQNRSAFAQLLLFSLYAHILSPSPAHRQPSKPLLSSLVSSIDSIAMRDHSPASISHAQIPPPPLAPCPLSPSCLRRLARQSCDDAVGAPRSFPPPHRQVPGGPGDALLSLIPIVQELDFANEPRPSPARFPSSPRPLAKRSPVVAAQARKADTTHTRTHKSPRLALTAHGLGGVALSSSARRPASSRGIPTEIKHFWPFGRIQTVDARPGRYRRAALLRRAFWACPGVWSTHTKPAAHSAAPHRHPRRRHDGCCSWA